LLVVVAVGPIVARETAQPASRLSLTAAFVDHRSVDLGPYRRGLGVDFSKYHGHLRSDKAPGQPLFAVPAYALGRVLGAESAAHFRVHENLTLWMLVFWSATLPLAALLALLYVDCRRFSSKAQALAVTLLFGFGSMLLPYGANLFAHDLVALLGFGAWMLVSSGPIDSRRAVLAGFLAGAAVATEYEAAIVAAVLVAYLLVRDRRRAFPFLAGAVPPALFLAWYQWRAFGAPWRTPAAFYNSKSGYRVPSPHDVWLIFGGGRGLWVGAPLAIVALGAAVWIAVTGRGRLRDASIVALAIAVPYIVLTAGWSGTPGLEDPGPRYLIPALPFLAVPLVARWDRVRVIAVPAAVLGAFVAAGATWTYLLVAQPFNVLNGYWYYVRTRAFAPTLWSMAFGQLGVIVYGLTIAGALAVLVMAYRRTDVRLPVSEPLA
jgi:hypothetical protein